MTAPSPTGARRPDGRRPWAILQHVAHEGPGLIGRGAGRRPAFRFEVVRLDRGDRAPGRRLDRRTGGHGRARWASTTTIATRGCGPNGICWRRGRRRTPVLGVCLGAQQLAAGPRGRGDHRRQARDRPRAGRADRPPAAGIRWSAPSTADCRRPPSPACTGTRTPSPFPTGRSTWPPPRLFPHQAFRWGDRAYGFQFHVEVDRALAEALASRTCPPGSPWTVATWPRSRPWAAACSAGSSSTVDSAAAADAGPIDAPSTTPLTEPAVTTGRPRPTGRTGELART